MVDLALTNRVAVFTYLIRSNLKVNVFRGDRVQFVPVAEASPRLECPT